MRTGQIAKSGILFVRQVSRNAGGMELAGTDVRGGECLVSQVAYLTLAHYPHIHRMVTGLLKV